METQRCEICKSIANKECAGCGIAVYCGETCQKIGWSKHQQVCDNDIMDLEARFKYTSRRDILGYLASTSEFRPLYRLLQTAGLANALELDKQYTLFAPSKDAVQTFRASASFETMPIERLQRILKYHIIEGRYKSRDLIKKEKSPLKMLSGDSLDYQFTEKTGDLTLGWDNNVEVTKTNIRVQNGIIHRIDGVLIPLPK